MRPSAYVNPRSDDLFAERVRQALDAGADTARALEDRLRVHYPAATVHIRELAGDVDTQWYVYRDGRWIPDG